jgi:hypothetical protein
MEVGLQGGRLRGGLRRRSGWPADGGEVYEAEREGTHAERVGPSPELPNVGKDRGYEGG